MPPPTPSSPGPRRRPLPLRLVRWLLGALGGALLGGVTGLAIGLAMCLGGALSERTAGLVGVLLALPGLVIGFLAWRPLLHGLASLLGLFWLVPPSSRRPVVRAASVEEPDSPA